MDGTLTQPTEHFSLRELARALQGYTPPSGAFEPQGAWRLAYNLFSLARTRVTGTAPRPAGRVVLERTPDADGFRLRVTYTKVMLAGHRHVTTAELECAADALATPRAWAWQSEMFEGERAAAADVHARWTAQAGEGGVRFQSGSQRQDLPLTGAYTVNWCLFEAVQRLPRRPDPALQFTLLDHFDQAKPGHSIAFRKSATVRLGGRPEYDYREQPLERGTVYKPVRTMTGGVAVRFHVFEQLGRGVLPIVYWVDAAGRLLLVSAGVEAYVFDPAATA